MVHAQEELQRAQASLTTITQQIAVADTSVTERRADFGNIEQRAKSDAAQLASLPKEQCHQTAGVDRDGREWKKQACKVDARVPPLIENLKTSAANREAAAKLLEQAIAARAKLDKSTVRARAGVNRCPRSTTTLPEGPNDAYRSQKSVETGGHLGSVGWDSFYNDTCALQLAAVRHHESIGRERSCSFPGPDTAAGLSAVRRSFTITSEPENCRTN